MDRHFEPGVYRHFKENKPSNERLYYGIAKTIANTIEDYNKYHEDAICIKIFTAIHTETKEKVKVFLYSNGKFVTEFNENFVFYKALYGDEKYYVRPIEMFLSPRDTEKYPEFRQYWRMEKID